jgi:glutamine cyclotransferase
VVWLLLAGAAIAVPVVYVSSREVPPDSPPAAPAALQQGAPVLGYEVVGEHPHDREAFTQGLIYRDGFLYESTGHYGRSTLRKVEIASGRVVQQRRVGDRYFAEGLAAWGSRLIQLTWQENVGFVYDLASFEPTGTFMYPGEGWGLTHDGRRLIMSDGTSQLRFLDPDTMRELGRVAVTDAALGAVPYLNELEYVNGEVYANVWGSDRIAVVEPESGRVTAWIDLAGLLRPSVRTGAEDVLNGIAYDAAEDRLFVTGKFWSRLYEIRVRRGPSR